MITRYRLCKYRLKWEGLSGYSRSQFSKKSNKAFPHLDSNIVSTPYHSNVIKEGVISELYSFKEEEQQLLVEKKKLLNALNQLQIKFDNIHDRKSNLLAKMEKNILSELQSENKSKCMLFSVFTWGSSWTDGLVFTIMAESEVWAEELVREWLSANGRKDHKIDKVMALVSQDARGVINVGAKLLDV